MFVWCILCELRILLLRCLRVAIAIIVVFYCFKYFVRNICAIGWLHRHRHRPPLVPHGVSHKNKFRTNAYKWLMMTRIAVSPENIQWNSMIVWWTQFVWYRNMFLPFWYASDKIVVINKEVGVIHTHITHKPDIFHHWKTTFGNYERRELSRPWSLIVREWQIVGWMHPHHWFVSH